MNLLASFLGIVHVLNKNEIGKFVAFLLLYSTRILTRSKKMYAGLSDIITTGLGLLMAGIFSIVILAVLGAFANIGTIWPTANVTKITTNIANAVVTGAGFLSIVVVLIEVGLVFVVLGLVASAVKF